VAAGESEHGGHAVPSRDRDGLRAAMSRYQRHPADVITG
jgi:hypothetical protein